MQKDIFYLDNPDIVGIKCDRFSKLEESLQVLLKDVYNSKTQAIELPKLYGLKVRERRQAKSILEQESSIQAEAAQLAIKVAEKSGESVETIAKAMDDPQKQLLFFSEHLEELQALLEKQNSVTTVDSLITAILQARISKDWVLDNTLDLPEHLYFAFEDYLAQERAGWPEDTVPKSPQSKPSDDPPKQEPKNPTGKKSASKSKANSPEKSS